MVKALKKNLKPGENPLYKIANSRKKHEVLNRRVNGEDRNVGRVRAKLDHWHHLYLFLISAMLGN